MGGFNEASETADSASCWSDRSIKPCFYDANVVNTDNHSRAAASCCEHNACPQHFDLVSVGAAGKW